MTYPNSEPVWLPTFAGPGHKDNGRLRARCGELLTGMRQATLVQCAVYRIRFCKGCWPEQMARAGWPLSI